jgi:hypothetical protein
VLSVDDYEVKAPSDERWWPPFAVVGESKNTELFYDPEELAKKVQLRNAVEEQASVEDHGDDGPLVASWGTPARNLLLLFEVPAESKMVTLRHGGRTFSLHPESGTIDGKQP